MEALKYAALNGVMVSDHNQHYITPAFYQRITTCSAPSRVSDKPTARSLECSSTHFWWMLCSFSQLQKSLDNLTVLLFLPTAITLVFRIFFFASIYSIGPLVLAYFLFYKYTCMSVIWFLLFRPFPSLLFILIFGLITKENNYHLFKGNVCCICDGKRLKLSK